MNIALTGASGFIGRHLKNAISKLAGVNLILIVRNKDNSVNNKATDMFTIIGEQLLNNVMKNMTNLENQNVTPPFPFNLPNIANYPSNIQSNLANAQTIKDVNTQEATIIKPLIQILEITYLQAYKGCILPIEIERKIYVNELTNTFTTEKETIYIDIPKGVDTNEIIFF